MKTIRQAGFSLIEIMAVVFIISWIVGIGVFMFSDKDPQRILQKSIERFALLSRHINEMASIDGEAYGLILEPPAWREDPFTQGWRYSWQRLSQQGWIDVEGLEPAEFPLHVDLQISIESQPWKYDDEPQALVPIIGFFPGGDVTPFEIEILHEEMDIEAQHVEVNEWGEIVWRERAEAEAEAKEREDRI